MSVVEDLKRKVQSLQDQLVAANKSLYEAQLAEAGLVPEKTIVLHKGEEYLVQKATFYSYGAWVYGRKRKKDGGWSENGKYLYDQWVIQGQPDSIAP